MKFLTHTIRWTPIICFPLLMAITSCTEESLGVANGIAKNLKGTPVYSLQAIGPHQLVLRQTTDSTSAIVILDWVDMNAPLINMGQAIDHYELQNDGRDLVLIGGGVPLARFSTGDDPVSTGGEVLYHVNGISKLTDKGGFAMAGLGSSSFDDAFDAVNMTRKNGVDGLEKPGHVGGGGKVPVTQCDSGGLGASSCSTSSSGAGWSCSVTCGSGYYACCDLTGGECKCVKQ